MSGFRATSEPQVLEAKSVQQKDGRKVLWDGSVCLGARHVLLAQGWITHGFLRVLGFLCLEEPLDRVACLYKPGMQTLLSSSPSG